MNDTALLLMGIFRIVVISGLGVAAALGVLIIEWMVRDEIKWRRRV